MSEIVNLEQSLNGLGASITRVLDERNSLLEALRDIARRAEDETLGIQAARLTAIANQAHAAIKDSEATP